MKCPECDREIKELFCDESVDIKGTATLGFLFKTLHIKVDNISQHDYEFRCPFCIKLLFVTKEDAEEFLKGRKEDEINES